MHASQSELLTFDEAVKLLPSYRGGKPRVRSTIYAWATSGLRGVKLELVDTASGLRVTRAALDKFFAAVAKQRRLDRTKKSARPSRRRLVNA